MGVPLAASILMAAYLAVPSNANLASEVASYNGNKNWRALRSALECVLSSNSLVYSQLQTIAWDDPEAPYHIGSGSHDDLATFLADISNGADISGVQFGTMLHGAAKWGQQETARALLTRGANLEAKDQWGSTPLVIAGSNDRLEMVRYLVEAGARVDGQSSYGWTALYWAANNGNLDMVKYLLGEGASTDLIDRDSKSPLDVARDKGHSCVVKYLSNLECDCA